MIELIKAEIAYRKWEYITLTVLPVLLVLLLGSYFNAYDSLGVDFTDVAVFGFGSALLIISLRLPQAIHNSNLEENRFHLFSTLPIPLRTMALTQSLPIFMTICVVSLLGLLIVGLSELGYSKMPMLLIFNSILLIVTIGFVNIFIKELLVLLPKYSGLVMWIVLIGILIYNHYRAMATGADGKLISLEKLVLLSTTFKLIAFSLVAFFGHIFMFTRLRDDFSVRRRFS